MRVFKQRYTRDGETKLSEKWYVEIRDHRQHVRRIPGFTDRGQTQKLGRRIEKLVASRVLNVSLDPDLSRWMETINADLRDRLVKFGLIDGKTVTNAKPLVCRNCNSTGKRIADKSACTCHGEHLSAFRQFLESKGNTPEHVELVTVRVRRILDGCGFTFFSDINASQVQNYLADERGKIRGISVQTSNHHLTALKSFCNWMQKDRRATESPVAFLEGLNVKTDRRHDRRHLTPDELSNLLQTTAKGPVRFRLTGMARAMLYRLAMESGLRRKELASLTVAHFELDSETPSVFVDAGTSKNRRRTLLPIRAGMVTELREWFQTLPEASITRLWPGLTRHTARMLKADLEAAGIAYCDDAGLFADFHSLRHSFVSMLAAGNVHPKLAQRLARHSDINLTMSRYSHTLLTDEAAALNALPEFPSAFRGNKPEGNELRATGTDDLAVSDKSCLPSCLPALTAFPCISVQSEDRKGTSKSDEPSATKNRETPEKQGKRGSEAERTGFEPVIPFYTVYRFSKPGHGIRKRNTRQQVTENAKPCLPSGLPELLGNSPDLRRVVDAWKDLPVHLKAAILALVSVPRSET